MLKVNTFFIQYKICIWLEWRPLPIGPSVKNVLKYVENVLKLFPSVIKLTSNRKISRGPPSLGGGSWKSWCEVSRRGSQRGGEQCSLNIVLVNVLYFGGRQDWPCVYLVDKKYQVSRQGSQRGGMGGSQDWPCIYLVCEKYQKKGMVARDARYEVCLTFLHSAFSSWSNVSWLGSQSGVEHCPC